MVGYAPNELSKCTWSLNHSNGQSPHYHLPLEERKPYVCDNIMEYIGGTPLIKLKNISAKYGIVCDLYAKCEFLNPGGSLKDRIGYRMVQEAQKDGRLKPGATIIEPTSGNTGIGIAMAAAIFGYKCIIVIPEKMSKEKVSVLKGLGAKVIRTRTSARYDEEDSLFSISVQLRDQIENAIILDQYKNPYNPIAHYDLTGEEILRACDNSVDALIIGAGTGGTITGVSRKIKEKNPSCQIYGVDPYGSSLAPVPTDRDKTTSFYEVEGIGYDFIPTVLDRDNVDHWIKTDDFNSFKIARELISLEGLLCGGSSGSCAYAAIQVAKTLKKNQKCVVILPDSLRNYLSKFLDDSWMVERGFMGDHPINQESIIWWNQPCSKLLLGQSEYLSPKQSLSDAIFVLKDVKYKVIPVLDTSKKVIGVVSVPKLFDIYINSAKSEEKLVEHIYDTNYKPAYLSDTHLGKIYHMLNSSEEVIVLRSPNDAIYCGNITKLSLLSFIKENCNQISP